MPVIHPSLSSAYLRSGRGAISPGGKPRHPSTQLHSPAPAGGSRDIPRPEGIYNPIYMFWICPGASSQLDVPEKTAKTTRRHPN